MMEDDLKNQNMPPAAMPQEITSEEAILPEASPKETILKESEGIPKFIIITFAIIGILIMLLAAKSVLASFTEKNLDSVESPAGSKLTLKVNIPCSGHASLIIYEVEKLDGVNDVKFKGSGVFDVYYDPAKTSEQKILLLDIFKEYAASKAQ